MLKDLFVKYLNGTISPEELSRLYAIMQERYPASELDAVMESAFSDPGFAVGEGDYDKAAVFAGLLERMDAADVATDVAVDAADVAAGVDETADAADAGVVEPVVREAPVKRIWRRWAAVAAMLLLLVGGLYFYRGKGGAVQQTGVSTLEMPPGRDGAVLTLADGRKMSLDSLANGVVTAEGDVRARKEDGQISYAGNEAGVAGALYHTISTPRGRQFRLVLSDGTKVMLNAASSIRFPAVFTGKERKVYVSGEAYIETSRDKEHPFVVEGSRGQVEVLGTAFDIMDYQDEPYMETSLLEGAVRVSAGSERVQLMPGQQGQIERQSGKLTVKAVDTTLVTAWIRGMLALNNADLVTVMRQVSRWYDVDIAFSGKAPDLRLGGMIHRNVNLSIVLEFLAENGMHYKTEGKTIIISP